MSIVKQMLGEEKFKTYTHSVSVAQPHIAVCNYDACEDDKFVDAMMEIDTLAYNLNVGDDIFEKMKRLASATVEYCSPRRQSNSLENFQITMYAIYSVVAPTELNVYEAIIEPFIASCNYNAYGDRGFVEAMSGVIPMLESGKYEETMGKALHDSVKRLAYATSAIKAGVDCTSEIETFYECMANAFQEYNNVRTEDSRQMDGTSGFVPLTYLKDMPTLDGGLTEFVLGLTSAERKTLLELLDTIEVDVLKNALRR